MKKGFIIVITLLITILTSCSSQSNTNTNINNEKHNTDKDNLQSYETFVEVTEGDFVYRLSTERKGYTKGTPVKILADIEYIGDEESISISHAASPFYFPMRELTRDYDIEYEMTTPLITTTLTRGVPIQEVFSGGAGGYGSQDPPEYVEFMKMFMRGDYPIGEYVVHGFASFDVEPKTSNDTKEKVLIKADIAFRVME